VHLIHREEQPLPYAADITSIPRNNYVSTIKIVLQHDHDHRDFLETSNVMSHYKHSMRYKRTAQTTIPIEKRDKQGETLRDDNTQHSSNYLYYTVILATY
jgi:hypothetical protein